MTILPWPGCTFNDYDGPGIVSLDGAVKRGVRLDPDRPPRPIRTPAARDAPLDDATRELIETLVALALEEEAP